MAARQAPGTGKKPVCRFRRDSARPMVHNTTSDRALIVGAGHAASELAGSLRQGGFAGGITMVGEEPHLPYQRPPLSKAFLSGEADIEAIQLKSRASYGKGHGARIVFVLRGSAPRCRSRPKDRPDDPRRSD